MGMDDGTTWLLPEEVARLLLFTSSSVESISATVPATVLSWHPGPEEWCISEVLGHLIETERRGFAGRIRILLEQEAPELQTWDQVAVAGARSDCERPFEELLAEFQRMRDESVELVNRLRAEDLARGGRHVTVGYITVGELLQEWVYHDQNHLRQMLMNVQQYVWPAMGNTQRFY